MKRTNDDESYSCGNGFRLCYVGFGEACKKIESTGMGLAVTCGDMGSNKLVIV